MFEDIKLIAFDLDGTLLDSVPDLARAVDLAMQDMGYPRVTLEQASHWIGNGADVLVSRALSQNYIVKDDLDAELIKQARARLDQHYHDGGHQLSHLYPDVKDTLERLHQQGYTLALVTNKPSQFVPELLEQHQLTHLFSDVIGGDTFAEKKPNPFALNWLLDKHGLTAPQMLMVGDSKNDIQAAQAAGCHSFALTYGYNHGEPISDSQPDVVSDEFKYLLAVLSMAR
ncbi:MULTISPECIES: phosphoglycolate phosphatase [Aliivibrio]|uniref:Phosphoglycolate phosphatase n=2 Tax=Aliivibrio fischeri TaxID=668 RepID=B5FBM7_ALIFM|nr:MULTISPECIES: phosphoglycolate phosphatase [Aliivibrio]ACH65654.1 phosphoglycolate phosphatase, bacterial [Aliivibrio fischeri MJ11]EHN69384.1 phosphoglycolate phosphatase [Aliivibrio fischeri SR5]MBD1568540.1 phosphoglycolate phosphatase [Aliivibrio sp. S10_S31]MCE7555773.1 phosphoglycolate phosphatase [Aliivibrio fischeri]MCE7563603.1 phosphoglycolate phosphatase [Aliivibrio fischeri]